jgi:hypothetical protein
MNFIVGTMESLESLGKMERVLEGRDTFLMCIISIQLSKQCFGIEMADFTTILVYGNQTGSLLQNLILIAFT